MNLTNFAYDYWIKLIEAIEHYTSNKIDKDKECFYHNGVDLVAAFERRMYFEIMSNEYYDIQMKEAVSTKSTVVLNNSVHKDILSFIYPDHDIKFKVQFTPKEAIKNLIYSNKFLLNQYFKYTNSKSLSYKNKKAKYIFVTIHHKFIRYLAPVYETLEDALFVICDDEIASINMCTVNNYKYELLKKQVKLQNTPNKELRQLISTYESIKFFINNIEPECIIIPEGNAPIYELFNLVSKDNKDIKTICIQQGWSPVYHNGFRKMHYDVFLAWGEEFSRLLQQYNPLQKFESVGNHMLNLNKNDSQKKSITFFYQGVDLILTQKDNVKFFKFAIYLANEYEDINIVIREHPSHSIEDSIKTKLLEYTNIVFMNPDMYTLSEVLAVSKIAVSINSTVLYESMLFDVVPFSFNTTSFPCLEPNLSQMGIGIDVKNLDDAIDEIDLLLKKKDSFTNILNNIKTYKNKYFISYGDVAIKKITKIIKNINK